MHSGDLSFPVLLDTSEDIAQQYNVRGIPTTFLIDKGGIIKAIKVGPFRDMAELRMSLADIIP
jgi:peroxiredoxin